MTLETRQGLGEAEITHDLGFPAGRWSRNNPKPRVSSAPQSHLSHNIQSTSRSHSQLAPHRLRL